jgi:hypothetical protein
VSFEQDDQYRAAWALVLDQRMAIHQHELAGTLDALRDGIELGRRSNGFLSTPTTPAVNAAASLAVKQLPHLIERPALRRDDPHETTVLIAASHGRWLSRADLWAACQVFEPLSMTRVDALRRDLQSAGCIIATRRANQWYYVGIADA